MKILFNLTLFNFLGICCSFSYGIIGETGGGTTFGVLLGIGFTGLVTIIGSIILITIKRDLFKSKWYWFLILIILGICEATIFRFLNWTAIF